jgi:hypothetical protein
MKFLKIQIIPLVILFFVISACSKSDEPPATSPIIQQGTWRVSYFSDNGAVETNNYTGYVFTFNSNGSVTAVKNGVSTTGTWSPGTKESDNKLVLTFNAIALSELNTDWHFTEKSYSVLAMEHVHSGNGGIDVLILEKI